MKTLKMKPDDLQRMIQRTVIKDLNEYDQHFRKYAELEEEMREK
jgi:hypothetical protein